MTAAEKNLLLRCMYCFSKVLLLKGKICFHREFMYSLPSTDSRKAVVSCWQKNVHNTIELLRRLSLPSKGVVK